MGLGSTRILTPSRAIFQITLGSIEYLGSPQDFQDGIKEFLFLFGAALNLETVNDLMCDVINRHFISRVMTTADNIELYEDATSLEIFPQGNTTLKCINKDLLLSKFQKK
ncbi:hypothetical protein MFLAVUS_010415 [Mucor flavus]|uniref:Uncharacterized protein n=1 Tax=Mucor flavus TaxID=439312 RepID=A0ABP9ZCN0_9FUNG